MLALRLLLGGLLLLTGFMKVGEEEALAETLAIHGLLPGILNHNLAILIPWAELWAGALLVTGLWEAPSAFVAALLFGAFQLATGTALVRGLDVACGCFGKALDGMPLEVLYLIDLAGFAASMGLLVKSLPQVGTPSSVRSRRLVAIHVAALAATLGGGLVFRMLERSAWGGEPRSIYWGSVGIIGMLVFRGIWGRSFRFGSVGAQ